MPKINHNSSTIVMLLLCLSAFAYGQIRMRNVPVVDSRQYWYGDESWLMSEYRSQVETGEFRYREAKGSTLEVGSGIVFGSMWVTSLLYGVPYVLGADGVWGGRMVTMVLSAILCVVLYRYARSKQVDPSLALLAVFLLISSQAFIYTSHSARYDTAVSIGCLGCLIFFERVLSQGVVLKPATLVMFGAILPFAFLVNAHIVLTVLLAWIYAFVQSRMWSDWTRAAYLILGGFGAIILILFLYAVTNSDWTLLGPAAATGFVMNGLIDHLPLSHWSSPQLQWYYLSARGALLWQYAPMVVVTTLSVVFLGLLNRNREKRSIDQVVVLAILMLLAFACFEAPMMRSLIYVLPPILLIFVLLSQRLFEVAREGWISWGVPVVCAAMLVILLPGFERGATLADSLATESEHAYAAILQQINTKQRILGSAHSSAYLADRTNYLIDLFGWHPRTRDSVSSMLSKLGVHYATMLYPFHALDQDIYFERPITTYLADHARLIWVSVGNYCDYQARYSEGIKPGNDTIRLFEFTPN